MTETSENKSRYVLRPQGAIWKWAFDLPPVEQRYISSNSFLRFFLPPLFTTKSDDTYIYYQCAQSSFYTALIVTILHLISVKFGISFNFYFFEIFIDQRKIFESFSTNTAKVSALLISLLVIPFYVFKAFYNFNPKIVDVLWWYKQISISNKEVRWKVTIRFFPLLAMLYVLLYKAHYVVFYFSDPKKLNNDTFMFWHLALPTFLYLFVYFFVPIFIIFSIVVLYRYSGSYTHNINSNWIVKGNQND